MGKSVWNRLVQFDFDRIAWRKLRVAIGILFSLLQIPKLAAIFGSSLRVQQSAEGINEVCGGDGRFIRPAGVFSQVEGICPAVWGNFPAFGDAGNWLQCARIPVTKPFVESVNDSPFGLAGDGVGIDRLDLGSIDKGKVRRR